ncbi:MAG: NAD(P)-binding domain-containing protein [Pseudomonadota bacterium]
MTLPIISAAEAEPHLDWISLTEALAAGHTLPKARIGDTFLYRDPDTLLSRVAWVDGLGMAVKTATIFPENLQNGRAAVGGSVTVYSDSDGSPEAILDFGLVTKWKTAGDSLLAARRLARADSETILIVGAGTVGHSLREAYGAAFPDARFTVWNRSPERAEALAAAYPATEAVAELESAVGAADVITCATMSHEPVVLGDWLRPGQHLDLIGAFRPDMRETDDAALRRGRLFVDSFDTTVDHIGEIKTPLAEGVIARDALVADFYDLDRFTRAPDDITVFKNGGGAHLDLMTCRYVMGRVLA